MDATESLRMAWSAIRDHRLRSSLTTLGVVIGVAAVVTFVTLGASLEGAILGDVAAGQSPTIAVSTQLEGQGGPPGFGGDQPVFTERDVERIESLEGVATAVPVGTVPLSSISFGGQSVAFGEMTATTPAYFESVGLDNFSAGESFDSGRAEVVLNAPAAAVFAANVSVGDTVTVTPSGGEPVEATVAGVLAPATGGVFQPGTVQPRLFGPVDPFYRTTQTSPATGEEERAFSQLTVVAADFERVDATADAVRAYLADESDARLLLPAAYEATVQTNEEFVAQIQRVLDTLTGFVTGIAVISLVVGAIGIANIMLVSVTERTREIGIMKAVGFQNRDVLQLFLVEAVVLGVIGSLVGVGVGVLAGYVATGFLDLPFVYPVTWTGVAVVVGVVVGVVAGLYPAWDAARVDPIDALRYE
jgi:putative ABC transport system permease protein